MTQTDHARQSETLRAYRDAAQALAMGAPLPGSLRVAERANVWVIEDGAFVEATLWVPRSALQPHGSSDEAANANAAVPSDKRGAEKHI